MPTSAAGSEIGLRLRPLAAVRDGHTPRGFTLIELMVVVALIAIATAGVSLSLRDSAASALERDAQRLAAVLESARSQSRAIGAPVFWQAHGQGFVLLGLPPQQAQPNQAQNWLSETTRAQASAAVVLGPEPLIPPQSITLYNAQQPTLQRQVATDGLHPFALVTEPAGSKP